MVFRNEGNPWMSGTNSRIHQLWVAIGTGVVLLAAGCGSAAHSGATSGAVYSPKINPSDFSTTISNPYLPLVPGTRFVYEGEGADGRERTVTEVTRETKKVMGIDTVVVHDTVTLDGKLVEDTNDWYAQDKAGNVWYFGEATKGIGFGGLASTAGSFEAGVDGALPGIAMPAHPKVGDRYRQEYYRGVAEDIGEVLSTTDSATVATGSYADVVRTKDTNPLDPSAAIEHKYYARDVGFVLVRHVAGPPERVGLTKIEKF